METLMTAAENNTDGSPVEKAAEAPAEAVAEVASEKQASTQEAAPEKTEAKAEDSKTEEAPKELSDFNAPEGVSLDPEAASELKVLAKELGLKQDGAQKIADIGTKLSQKWEARQSEKIQSMQKEWAESSKTDKEFGGDNLSQNLAVAKKALDAFGSPELRTLLNDSGLGNHPELIRAFFRAGKAISEDRFVNGGAAVNKNGGDRDFAKSLYPNQ
mgnify:CR=1 FL=1